MQLRRALSHPHIILHRICDLECFIPSFLESLPLSLLKLGAPIIQINNLATDLLWLRDLMNRPANEERCLRASVDGGQRLLEGLASG